MRSDQGEIKRLQDDSVYSKIKEYFAKRTFDESGDYSVEPFRVQLQECLNDEIGNEGLFTEDRLTEEKRFVPSEDLLAVKLSSGRAYVKGYDIDLPAGVVMDVNKKYFMFRWQVEKYLESGLLKNCWLTTVVSAPVPMGSSI